MSDIQREGAGAPARFCACQHTSEEHPARQTGDRPCSASGCPCERFSETWACGACGTEYDNPGDAAYCHYGCVGVL